jgi:hypothetical protein
MISSTPVNDNLHPDMANGNGGDETEIFQIVHFIFEGK